MRERTRPRRRRPAALTWALFAAALITVGLLTPAGMNLVSSTTGTAASVYYSGEGCAGLFSAGSAVRRLRAQQPPCYGNGGFGTYNGRWTSDTSTTTCSSDAALFPPTIDNRIVDQLVGYSLGRLGVLYFLEAATADAKSHINSIVLIDPGSSDLLDNACDVSASLDAAGRLRDWLSSNPTNRLTVLAGTLTQAENYAGLTQNYLAKLSNTTVGSQVTVCAADIDHDAMIHKFGYLAGVEATGACPDSSQPATIRPVTTAPALPSSPPTTSQAPPSPTEPQPAPETTTPTPKLPAQNEPAPTNPPVAPSEPTAPDTPYPAALGSTPTFAVFNTTWSDGTVGVFFRYAPQWASTTSIPRLGVYDGEQVQIFCYTEGEPVAEYANTIWYQAVNVTRPLVDNTPDQGFLNAHFVQDGMAPNVPYPGVVRC